MRAGGSTASPTAVGRRLGSFARRFAWLRGRSFAANVAFMVTGTALGQAASIVLAPVLTRLYSPDQFGYLSVYTAALMIFSVVAVLGFALLALPGLIAGATGVCFSTKRQRSGISIGR